MDILGIGGWELAAILLIGLVVAGPKRMIRWAYIAGRYIGQARRMWSETAAALQREFDGAGVEVKVPRSLPTRASLNRDVSRALGLDSLRVPSQPQPPTERADFGTWSGEQKGQG